VIDKIKRNKMTNKTELGKDIIPEELIGRDASLREGKYNDDYLSMISQIYPLNDVLGSRIEGLAARNQNDLYHFTRESPLGNLEGENILEGILYTTANTRAWQPKIIDVGSLTDIRIETAEEYLEAVESINPTHNKRMADRGVMFGIAVAQRGKFVLPTKYENNVVILPSQRFIEYCVQQGK